jgi:NAD(P)H-hydrate repair Nnr-like enzyme with NAD(P)H-hydrate epimerase domain
MTDLEGSEDMKFHQEKQSKPSPVGRLWSDYGLVCVALIIYAGLLIYARRWGWLILTSVLLWRWGEAIWVCYHRGRNYDRIALVHLLVVCPVIAAIGVLLIWLAQLFLAFAVGLLGCWPAFYRFLVDLVRLERQVVPQSAWLSRVQENEAAFTADSSTAVFEQLELENNGFVPDALILCGDGLKGRIGVQLAAQLQKEGYGVTLLHAVDGWKAPEKTPELIVDAMDEPVEEIVNYINATDRNTEVCAIDVPCGIDPDQVDGTVSPCFVCATETLALGQWRPIHKNRNLPVADYLGHVRQLRV